MHLPTYRDTNLRDLEAKNANCERRLRIWYLEHQSSSSTLAHIVYDRRAVSVRLLTVKRSLVLVS